MSHCLAADETRADQRDADHRDADHRDAGAHASRLLWPMLFPYRGAMPAAAPTDPDTGSDSAAGRRAAETPRYDVPRYDVPRQDAQLRAKSP